MKGSNLREGVVHYVHKEICNNKKEYQVDVRDMEYYYVLELVTSNNRFQVFHQEWEKNTCILLGEAERRSYSEHIPIKATFSNQNSHF